MFFWHLGASLWMFRWVFKDPKVDIRFLLLGAILADLIDLTVGTIIFPERFSTGELWFHTLLLPALYMALALVVTRRGRSRRALMALGVGWLFHLLLDGMWLDPEVFFWPFFGWEMPVGQAPFWPLAWERAMADPWRWVLEAIGVAYLAWLWVSLGLEDRERRRTLLHQGRLPYGVTDAT